MTARPTLPLDVARLHRRATAALARTFPGVPRAVREELVQDAWIRLFEQDRAIEAPGAWLVRVASRRAIDWWRRVGRPGRVGLPLDDELPDPPPDLLGRLDGARLVRLLEQAPEHHRRTLEGLYLDELGVEELAAELGVSRDALRRRRDSALDWLRRVSDGEGPRQTYAREAVSDRRARIVEHLRARPGWHPTDALRGELRQLLGCTRNELAGVLQALRRAGVLEVRGTRRRAEYRLAPSGSAP